MEITIKVPEKLAAEARAHGVSVEVYVQEILTKRTLEAGTDMHLPSIRSAVDRIVELPKGNKLAGLRIKDLIHEGHRF